MFTAVRKMSNLLYDTLLLDLLPPSIGGDKQVEAMATAIQPELDSAGANIALIELYKNLENLPDGVLHMLAWENKMAGAEWALTRTREERIDLIANSFELNKLRGTRWAVERIFTLLRFRPQIIEWWEEGGHPHTFRISVLDIADRGLSAEELKLIDELIWAYKPLRSWVTGIGISLSADVQAKINAFTTQTGVLTVGPMDVGAQAVDFGYTVYPKQAVTLSGIMDVGVMDFYEQEADFNFAAKVIKGITINGVLDVGPMIGNELMATATQHLGVGSFTQISIQ